jgi:hypothetical protein
MKLELDLEQIQDCTLFEIWLSKARNNGLTDENIRDILTKSEIPTALVRLALFCLWQRDFDGCKKALGRGYLTNDENIQFFCKMLAQFFEMYETHRLPSTELRAQYGDIQQTLLRGLKQIREKKTRVKFDIELELFFLFGMPLSAKLGFQEKLAYAEEGLYCANLLGCNFYKDQFKTQIATLAEGDKNPNDGIQALYKLLESDRHALNSEWQYRSLAYQLSDVTNFKQAFETIEQGFSHYGRTPSLSGAYEIIAIMSGNLAIEELENILEGYASRGKYQNMLFNVSNLSQTYSIFLDRASSIIYNEMLTKVILNYETGGISEDEGVAFYQKWCRSLAYLKLGKVNFALRLADELMITSVFSFNQRILRLGLLLEISLQNKSNLKPIRIINEFISLFEDYKKTKFSSLKGASELLFRWHPKSAIVLSLLPGIPVEFQRWQEAIVNCHKTPYVYARSIPIAYFEECILRNFDFDTQTSHKLIFATLNSRDNKRKRDLRKNCGQFTLALPVVSSAFCLYALKKMDSNIFQDTIDWLIRQFGLFPEYLKSSASNGLSNIVLDLVEKLVKNQISVSEFDLQIFER